MYLLNWLNRPLILISLNSLRSEEKVKGTTQYKYHRGLSPYYVISYEEQGPFQMIIEDYNKGPRVVRKDYVL